jgi:RNA polymerase sigma-70 factor (ECF subfamily)
MSSGARHGLPGSATALAAEPTYAELRDLVRKVEEGDDGGMEQLYQVLSKGIRFFLLRRLPHSDVEDKVHEVFVDVVSAIRRQEIRDPARLMGFVRTVIHRKVAKQIGNLVRDREEQASYNAIEHVPDGRKTPEQMAAATELTHLVSATLSALNPRDRELLVRYYLWEQTGEQICKEMSLSATQFRVFKSRAKLRFGDLGRKTVGARRHALVAPRVIAGLAKRSARGGGHTA